MRWIVLLILALAGVILQTTLVQVLWFSSPAGSIGPDVLAILAVFVALNVRGGADAALAA